MISKTLQNTAKQIIKEFNNNKVHYALARNYEKFPNFGRDIDFFSSEPISKLKKILNSVAKKNKWDCLVHDNHFKSAFNKTSDIDVFHFYKFKSGKYEVLHLDFFRGSLLLGLPFIWPLITKKLINKKELFIIDQNSENIFKLLTINSHISNKNEFQKKYIKKKIKLYSKKVITYSNKNKNFEIIAKNKGVFFAKKAIYFLKKNNHEQFKFYMNFSRIIFFIKYFFLNPLSFLFYISSRIIDLINHYFLNPTGSVINFCLEDIKHKQKIFNSLNLLKNKNFISSWKLQKKKVILNSTERKILERHGVIVSFNSDIKNGSVLIKKNYDLNKIVSLLVLRLVKKNSLIYQRK